MPAPSLVNLACPQCGLESSANIESLRATKGWHRCPGCSEIFDGFRAPGSSSEFQPTMPSPLSSMEGAPIAQVDQVAPTFFPSSRPAPIVAPSRRPAPKRVGQALESSIRSESTPAQGQISSLRDEAPLTPKSNIKTRVYAVAALPRKAGLGGELGAYAAPQPQPQVREASMFPLPTFEQEAPASMELPAKAEAPMPEAEPWNAAGGEQATERSMDGFNGAAALGPEGSEQGSWDASGGPILHASPAAPTLAALFEDGMLAASKSDPQEEIDTEWGQAGLDFEIPEIEPILLAKRSVSEAAPSQGVGAAQAPMLSWGDQPIAVDEQRAQALAALDSIGADEPAWPPLALSESELASEGFDLRFGPSIHVEASAALDQGLAKEAEPMGADFSSDHQVVLELGEAAQSEERAPMEAASAGDAQGSKDIEPVLDKEDSLKDWSSPSRGREAAAVEAFASGAALDLDLDLAQIEASEPALISVSSQAMGLWLDESSKARAEAAAKESAAKRMESIAAKGAGPKAQARARVLAVPAPDRNKPVEPMLAKTASEALSLARAARFNPFAAAKLLPSLTLRQWMSYGGCVLALALALALQSAWFGRGESSARSAQSKAIWHSVCAKLSCVVELPQARASLELEGADVRLDPTGRLIFSAALKNSADYESQAPRLWLSIEGPGGKVLASKTFEPVEWLGVDAIGAGASLDSQLAFDPLSNPPEGFKAQLVWPAAR